MVTNNIFSSSHLSAPTLINPFPYQQSSQVTRLARSQVSDSCPKQLSQSEPVASPRLAKITKSHERQDNKNGKKDENDLRASTQGAGFIHRIPSQIFVDTKRRRINESPLTVDDCLERLNPLPLRLRDTYRNPCEEHSHGSYTMIDSIVSQFTFELIEGAERH